MQTDFFYPAILRVLASLTVLSVSSCVSMRDPAAVAATDRAVVSRVTGHLTALPGAGERTRPEATHIASVAVAASREQAARYEVSMSGWWHNMMVNAGMKERGLCWQWMEDIFPKLRALDTRSFRIVCGVRNPGTRREHHCVVAIPSGRPFEDGLVLDPWVKGGELHAFPVRGARRKWKYDPLWTAPLEQRIGGRRESRAPDPALAPTP